MIDRLKDTEAALEQLQEAFSRRPLPSNVSYCPCCFEAAWMESFLRKAPSELTPEDLNSILWDAYLTWGNWPSFAFYVPRLLELYALDRLPDADMLFYKLLWAARPELLEQKLGAPPMGYIEEAMQLAERSGIFQFVQAAARAEMRNPDVTEGTDRIHEALSFLAAFDAPIAPLIEDWKSAQEPIARGRFCLLLTDYTLQYDPAEPLVENTYLGTVPVLRENIDALASLVDPEFVAGYLVEHAASAALFGGEDETYVGLAFDWAAAALKTRTPGRPAI
jgi:hypothetical protein